ncbi:MAG: hypothetical protein AAGJ81_10680 [Verrucomicrobiota bacterium]
MSEGKPYEEWTAEELVNRCRRLERDCAKADAACDKERKAAEEFVERTIEEREKAAKQIHLLTQQNHLLGAGINPRWNDETLLAALSDADTKEGPLGACLALIDRAVEAVRKDGEDDAEGGKLESAAACSLAAARIRQAKDKIVELWRQSKGMKAVEHRPRGYGA